MVPTLVNKGGLMAGGRHGGAPATGEDDDVEESYLQLTRASTWTDLIGASF